MTNKTYNLTPKNKKSIVANAVIFPIVVGIVVALATAGFTFGGSFFDITNNNPIAYFDSTDDTKIAQMSFGDSELSVVDGYNYSTLGDSVCFVKGSRFGDVGVGYCLALGNNVKSLNKQNIAVTSDDKTYKYEYRYSFSANNENEVLNRSVGISKGIVLYCQNAGDYGFSSDYTALVYEEVAQ